MTLFPRSLVLLLLVLFAVASAGCFRSSTFQASSGSSSDFSSSPFKSSSKSSSPDDDATRDVRDATEFWSIRGGDVDTLRRDVGRIAREYGITDWEHHAATYRAIGRGLPRSALEGEVLDTIVAELATGAPHAFAWIETGYELEGLN